MANLTVNLINRIKKLPKPSTTDQCLQPLFESVSNALYAIEERFCNEDLSSKGKVTVQVENFSDPETILIKVHDNGIGLNEERYKAFCTVDTDFNSMKGGKGVGRLFWLDAFTKIEICSTFNNNVNNKIESRNFEFKNNNQNQIINLPNTDIQQNLGTTVTFTGIRIDEYKEHFPKKVDVFLKCFTSHFIADFLVNKGPMVSVILDDKKMDYPKSIFDLVLKKYPFSEIKNLEKYGNLQIEVFLCKKKASTSFTGNHQLHFLADGRSVDNRKIDQLICLKNITHDNLNSGYIHCCVSGKFLNKHVNEGRTAFNVTDSDIAEISRLCSEYIHNNFIKDQIDEYRRNRRIKYQDFIHSYPIFGFIDEEKQLESIPLSTVDFEGFASGLATHLVRRDKKRTDQIQKIIKSITSDELFSKDLADEIQKLSKTITSNDKLALAQHVVRRKIVLEILDVLIRKIRNHDDKDDDNYLEQTLHTLLVPMRVSGVDSKKIESSAHDLWIIDERLAFTRFFASDLALSKILSCSSSSSRPDLIIWDQAFGLGPVCSLDASAEVDTTLPLNEIMIVEFKRPGRTEYSISDQNIEQQVTKYIVEFKNNKINTFNGRNVRVSDNCFFHCFVIADIVGDLEPYLAGWSSTANGLGRIRHLENVHKGVSIEVIQWQDLLNNAMARNRAALFTAGLSNNRSE